MVFQEHNPRLSDEWTSERIALLLRLDAENKLSRSQIAKRLAEETGSKFSRNAVIGKLMRLGVPKKDNRSEEPPKKSAAVKKITQEPPVILEAPIPIGASLKLSLDQLKRTSCRYVTSADGLPFEFCGHTIFHRSFCAAHYRICYYTQSKIKNIICEAA